jgi:uncharacterized RDD family membrane protein YckC/uncharacterized membrane protein SpoIIM required for sporulation
MDRGPATRPARHGRYVEVETPEHVSLRLEVAGVWSRALATFYDSLFVLGLALVATVALAFAGLVLGSAWAVAFLILVNFGILWGYFAAFEALWDGRTPGKRRAGIRVIMDTGHPLTVQAALIRNLVRLVDFQPGLSGFVGLLSMILHPHGKRLGDFVAGTIVVRDEVAQLRRLSADTTPAEAQARAGQPAALAAAARLDDREFQLLDGFLKRAPELPPPVRERFTQDLVGRLSGRFPDRDPAAPTFLSDVFRAEQAARQAPGAARREAAGVRLRVAERFVALRQDRWETFRKRAVGLEREGLARLTGDEVLSFAADYRAVAADLARAETYGVDDRTVSEIGRVVTAGHNALYGMRRPRRPPAAAFLLAHLPAAVMRQRRYVIAAALMFLLPGTITFSLIRERPPVALEILPDVVLARAASGPDRVAEGQGYAETPSPYLPIVASGIIANNVQVAFGAFALGVTAGVGTLLILVFNGLFFGAVLGHYANVGLAGWLLTFVAGHGVLELTAIFIAGGAGLLVARALVIPGDLPRREALVLHGREAIRMVGAAAGLLVLAGLIEGLLSASNAPAALKVGVSATSAVLLVLLALAGRPRAARGGHRRSWAAGE